MPPLELHLAPGVATLVEFKAPLRPEPRVSTRDGGVLQMAWVEDGSLILVPTAPLASGEPFILTLPTGEGSEPLRFALVTRRDVVDLRVRVVRAPVSADEDGAELMARNLLVAPGARATLAVPQEVVDYNARDSRGRVESVLWLGRRFFVTVAVRSRKKGSPLWTPVQARLRATLADGVLLEWPARLVSGAASPMRQCHVLTSLLPEEASHLELALDGEDSPGIFQPVSPDEGPARP